VSSRDGGGSKSLRVFGGDAEKKKIKEVIATVFIQKRSYEFIEPMSQRPRKSKLGRVEGGRITWYTLPR